MARRRRIREDFAAPTPAPIAEPEPVAEPVTAVEVPPDVVNDPPEPPPDTPPAVVFIPAAPSSPSVSELRAEYERLARLVPTLKPGSPEFKAAMEAKRLAFIAWHNAK
jgi:hypothetical protein